MLPQPRCHNHHRRPNSLSLIPHCYFIPDVNPSPFIPLRHHSSLSFSLRFLTLLIVTPSSWSPLLSVTPSSLSFLRRCHSHLLATPSSLSHLPFCHSLLLVPPSSPSLSSLSLSPFCHSIPTRQSFSLSLPLRCLSLHSFTPFYRSLFCVNPSSLPRPPLCHYLLTATPSSLSLPARCPSLFSIHSILTAPPPRCQPLFVVTLCSLSLSIRYSLPPHCDSLHVVNPSSFFSLPLPPLYHSFLVFTPFSLSLTTCYRSHSPLCLPSSLSLLHLCHSLSLNLVVTFSSLSLLPFCHSLFIVTRTQLTPSFMSLQPRCHSLLYVNRPSVTPFWLPLPPLCQSFLVLTLFSLTLTRHCHSFLVVTPVGCHFILIRCYSLIYVTPCAI